MGFRKLKKEAGDAAVSNVAEIDSVLSLIEKEYGSLSSSEDYKPDATAASDYDRQFDQQERGQRIQHREKLFRTVSRLAYGSFWLLSAVIAAQVLLPLMFSNYKGVSDGVIQIIAISVFGQVLVVMGGLSRHIWRPRK